MRAVLTGMAAALLAAVLFSPVKSIALSAEKAIVIDGQTGRVIYDKNADQQSLIASTTKIMTALVVCEQCNVLDRVRIPKEAVGIEGSSMYLREGEILTVQELLYGLMLQSGNDAAVALAIYCGGTVEGFAGLMNDKAFRLGMKQTHYVNPHGLDAAGHYSTAKDLGILACYAMNNPIFARTVSTKSIKIGERYLTNHNKLLWQVPGANGVKTGFTKAAGRILVSSAERNGRDLICVTINAPDDWNDHKQLLEKGFSEYAPVDIIKKGDIVGAIPVAGGQSGMVQLIASEDFCYAMHPSEQTEIRLPTQSFVYAPVVEGAEAGFVHILVNGEPVGKIPILYGETVELEAEPTLPWWKRIFSGG